MDRELAALGFDLWFEERAGAALRPGRSVARVTAVDRDAYLIRGPRGEAPAELAGRLRFATADEADLPCVGDWVGVQDSGPGGPAIIHAVLPRRTVLRRKAPGAAVAFQMIAANVDVAFLVQSCHYDFNVRRLERYLVVARDGGIRPRILLTKADLVTPGELEALLGAIRGAGIGEPPIVVSAATGAGMNEFRGSLLPGATHCLLGSSGVGKTTLLNLLLGREALATKTVSGTGEGVHTTARRQLFRLEAGALMIDTPGMRELGLLGAGGGLDASFPEIRDLSRGCRFCDCTHGTEPGCAVLAALRGGDLSEETYRSYLKLRRESEHHDRTYAEKRKKDKDFGRMVRSALKNRRK